MSTDNIKTCIVCNSKNIGKHLNCVDHFVSGESFSIARCHDCGFCFTSPRPSVKVIGKYYESEEYVSHSKTSAGFINRLFHLARLYTLRSKKRIVNKYADQGNLLDYGCGSGEFLKTMSDAGHNVVGIEPDMNTRKLAINEYGLNIVSESDLSGIPDGSLSSITLWHVLEHVYPLEERIKSFYQKLSNTGTLFVALPNIASYDAKKYKAHWAAYDVPRHIYHFDPLTIKRLMNNFGFNLYKTLPMHLDAIYISMLSEKYKTGSAKNLKAIFSGMYSNFHALTHKGNYSSLIYIFKKS